MIEPSLGFQQQPKFEINLNRLLQKNSKLIELPLNYFRLRPLNYWRFFEQYIE